MTIPEEVKNICHQLINNGQEITRRNILEKAKSRNLNPKSILPADYCDNKKTGNWSTYKFLHWEGRGRYTLLKESTYID